MKHTTRIYMVSVRADGVPGWNGPGRPMDMANAIKSAVPDYYFPEVEFVDEFVENPKLADFHYPERKDGSRSLVADICVLTPYGKALVGVILLARGDNKNNAIKDLKVKHNVGLLEAKLMVDEYSKMDAKGAWAYLDGEVLE